MPRRNAAAPAAGETAGASAACLGLGEHNNLTTADVLDAVQRNGDDKDEHTGYSGWRSCCFEFVRTLRGHPALENLDACEAADAIEPLLAELYGDDPWSTAFGDEDSQGNHEDSLESFLGSWDKIEPGRSIAEAAQRARRRAAELPTDTFGADLAHPRRHPFRCFLVLCSILAGWAQGGIFVLAVEPAAEAMATDRKCIGRWRKEAVERGLLREVSAPEARRAAGRYALGDHPSWDNCPPIGGAGQ